jgi:oligopeptide transport system permease protein
LAIEQPAALPTSTASYTFTSKQRGLWAQAFQRLRRNRLAMVAGILLLIIAAIAIAADLSGAVQRYAPGAQDYGVTEQGPSAAHWLGTDTLGRDLWARLLQATLFSLKVGIGAQLVVLVIGITVGMLAALGGRLTDQLLMWLTDLAFAFPDLLAIILLRQVLFGRNWPILGSADPQIPGFGGVLMVTILAISFVAWTTVARCVGASPWRVVRYHMLPNTLGSIIVASTFGIPAAIFAEAALSFIGLGVPTPDSSLGTLIASGQDHIQTHQIELWLPAVMVAVLMLCFTFLGDGLRDALDPRTRK